MQRSFCCNQEFYASTSPNCLLQTPSECRVRRRKVEMFYLVGYTDIQKMRRCGCKYPSICWSTRLNNTVVQPLHVPERQYSNRIYTHRSVWYVLINFGFVRWSYLLPHWLIPNKYIVDEVKAIFRTYYEPPYLKLYQHKFLLFVFYLFILLYKVLSVD